MLRTPILEDKIKKYINEVVPQHPDSLIPEIDRLILASAKNKNEEYLRYMLGTLYNIYNNIDVDIFLVVFIFKPPMEKSFYSRFSLVTFDTFSTKCPFTAVLCDPLCV